MLRFRTKRKSAVNMAQVPVIGICRFSYPTTSGFKVRFKTPDAQAAYLYSDARMEVRFSLFEAITLPSLRAQRDPDFRFIVVIGSDLPARWRDRLEAGLSSLPLAEAVALEPRQPWSVFGDAIRSRHPGVNGPVLQFRLDDDDGVAVDFIARLRQLDGLPELRRQGRGAVAVNFTSGLDIGFDETRFLGVTEAFAHSASYGQALLTRQDVKRTVMGFQHHKIWQEVPHVSLPGGPMFLRTRHPGQDTPRGRDPQPVPLPRAEASRVLEERFGLSLKALEAIRWGAPGAGDGENAPDVYRHDPRKPGKAN